MENTATMEQGATTMTTMGNLSVSDVSGQRNFRINSVPMDSTIGDLVNGLLSKMEISRNDSEGRPRTFKLRLQREARHLGAHELVRDALQEGDSLSIHPSVTAG